MNKSIKSPTFLPRSQLRLEPNSCSSKKKNLHLPQKSTNHPSKIQVTPESGKSYFLQGIFIKVPIPISSIEKTPKYPIFYSHFSSFTEQWPTSGSPRAWQPAHAVRFLRWTWQGHGSLGHRAEVILCLLDLRRCRRRLRRQWIPTQGRSKMDVCYKPNWKQ